MIRRPLYALTALLALALGGCGSQKGKTVFTAGPDSGPNVGTAPQDGTYQLYTAASPNPTTTVKLKQGDKLGFDKGPDGKIVAVYGDQRYPFDKLTSQVYWKLED